MRDKLESGIYVIRNTVNGKVYIGQAQYLARRIYEHKYHLERGTDKCTLLQRAVTKYGLENFSFSTLEECHVDLLNEREIYWINKMHSTNPSNGYNINSGGDDGGRGRKYPDEFGRRISEMKIGKHITDEHRRKISEAQKGKPKPEGMGAKLSASISGENHWNWGKKASKETRAKLSSSHSGIKNHSFGKKLPNASSQFYGVYKETKTRGDKSWTNWLAWVNRYDGSKVVRLGYYKDEVEAARAYDEYVKTNNLPHPLNFPDRSME